MVTENINKISSDKAKMSGWFDALISQINVERLMMETDIAPEDTKEFWTAAMSDDQEPMFKNIRTETTQYFIKKLVQYYCIELSKFPARPQKLAFDFSDAKILVWAQIKDDDEKSENALILSEAKSNNRFGENGFYVSTTIVEEGDKLAIPPHYHEVRINGRLSGAH